jgi:dipeptidyl aminopeptidase/acylaminoacyl peptidase
MRSSVSFRGYLACGGLMTMLSSIGLAQTVLTPAQALDYRRVGDLHFSPDGSKLAYVVYSYRWDWQPHLWLLDVASANARQITPEKTAERSPQWSPDGKALAFLSNRDGKTQIYTLAPESGAPAAVTARKYGVTSFHWSPDGRTIAYLAKDDDAPSTESGPQVADRLSDLPRLWIVDFASKATRRIGTPGYRVEEFQWQNSTNILVAAAEKPQVEEYDDAIYSVSLSDGGFKLSSRPPQPFSGLVVSPDARQYALRSTRANGPIPRDLFVGTIGRDDLKVVSARLDRAVAEVKWNEQATIWVRVFDGFVNRVWKLSATAAPMPVKLSLSVDAFDVSHEGLMAFAGGDFNHLPALYLRAQDGSVRMLAGVQEGWEGIQLARTEVFHTQSFDATPIEAALMKPAGEHPGEKLPLVLLVHGGPSSNFTAGYSWETAWAQMLVAHGYQILMVNPRGSNGYSEDFLKANRGDLGGGDFTDLMSVLDHVIAKGQTDPNRLGIGGWSYGGEMSAWAITQTGRFKAAVAGAPVFDQQAEFETESGPADDEWQFFGTPWERADVFARNSPATYIGNAHTPTLILDGVDDASNPVGQSKGLYRALKHLGIESQLVLYPNEGHSPRSGAYNLDMFERILSWYDRFLKPAE